VIHNGPRQQALLQSDMMLRDRHYRINTIGLIRHRKLSPYQKPAISAIITKFNAIMLHHTKSIFDDAGHIALFRPRSGRPQPAGDACPLSRRTLPMSGHGTTRLVW
jgi:hypothetical protein